MIAGRLEQHRKRSETISVRLNQPPEIDDSRQWIYYSNWQMAAVHLLLTIPGYDSPQSIAARLRTTATNIENILKRLEEIGLVRRTSTRWESIQNFLHLRGTSPSSPVNHLIWRHRAIDDLFADPAGSSGVHYTTLLTLSRADVERVKELVRSTIERTQQIVGPSVEEDLICFSCDIFRV